ncbi:MAG TPA: hypothetical protein VJ866_04635 [Pyrinomonadaceae bacterium]|nr:hypothetical protein [Pyrinomonadaceae bacterium]
MRTATVALCALLLLGFTACPPQRERVVFIFCDVTTSLEGAERAEVARMAADIVNHLPPGTSYRVYPIQAETAALTHINKELVIPKREKDEGLQESLDEGRQQELVDELANVSKETNARQDGNERRDDNRTCILNALNFAGNQLKQFPAERYDREIVIISDMLEECTQTPLKRPVNIKKPNITQELNLAGDFPEGNDFSHVRISIIVPVTPETYVRYAPGKKPPMGDLQAFWKGVFGRCKVPPEAENNGMYSWSNGSVPAYFLAQNK